MPNECGSELPVKAKRIIAVVLAVGFLAILAGFQAIPAGVRKCPGVTPTIRERADLLAGGLLIEADGTVAGMPHGGHRQVLLMTRRAVRFADVPDERLARSGCGRLQGRQRLLGRCDYCRMIDLVRKSALGRDDLFGPRRLPGAGAVPALTRATLNAAEDCIPR